MIIQIKSSYSGPLSHNLEDGQELFISHTHVTHAYVQKQATSNRRMLSFIWSRYSFPRTVSSVNGRF